MPAGALLLVWSLHADLQTVSFWLDHAVKAAAIYLLVLDGGFVLLTGLCRLMGSNVIDFARHPVLARTPADFWRRYNREAGQFLYADVYHPLGGVHRPIAGILAVFAVNGALHEYLAVVMTGAVAGYQTAFFLLQGAAVALTWRWRPRGVLALCSWACTLAFMLVTSVLFFESADQFIDWYSRGGLLP